MVVQMREVDSFLKCQFVFEIPFVCKLRGNLIVFTKMPVNKRFIINILVWIHTYSAIDVPLNCYLITVVAYLHCNLTSLLDLDQNLFGY